MPAERTPFVMVMPENDDFTPQGVTLVLNNGEEIDLNRENRKVLVQRLPQVYHGGFFKGVGLFSRATAPRIGRESHVKGAPGWRVFRDFG